MNNKPETEHRDPAGKPRRPEPFFLDIGLSLWIFIVALILLFVVARPLEVEIHDQGYISNWW